jgi:Concanavalin A-like lectin/glucanases superfamily/MBG domain/MBG domain (YGX type)/Bacterial Ig domain
MLRQITTALPMRIFIYCAFFLGLASNPLLALEPVATNAKLTVNNPLPILGVLTGMGHGGATITKFILASQPTKGVVTLLDENTGAYSYTSNSSMPSGKDTFTFHVMDSNNKTSKKAGKITVNFKLKATVEWPLPLTITYGQPLSTTASAIFNGAAITGTFVYRPALGTVLNAGVSSVKVTFKPDDKNLANTVVIKTITVNQADLLITSAATKVYREANPVLVPAYTGFVNGDTSSVISGTPLLSTEVTTNTPVGTYPITIQIGSLTASNYAFIVGPGTVSVTPASVTVALSNLRQVYNGEPRTVTVETNPMSAHVVVKYNNSLTEPIDPGTYRVLAEVVDSNFNSVSTTGDLVITALPIAANDQVTSTSGTSISIPVLANDWVTEGGTLSLVSFSQPVYGVVSLGVDGQSLVYSPTSNVSDVQVFNYTISDGLGGEAIGYVYVSLPPSESMVLHWKFDEDEKLDQHRQALGVHYVAWDSSTHAYGSAHNAGLYGDWSRVPGKLNNALAMHNGSIQAYDAADLHLQRMTIAMWIKPGQSISTMSPWMSLFQRYDWANNSGFWLGNLHPGEDKISFMLLNGTSVNEGKEIFYEESSVGAWIHLAATYDGQTMTLYRNGVVVDSAEVGLLTLNYPSEYAINSAVGYVGCLDDVRIYKEALSASDIASLMGTQPANTPPVISMGADQVIGLPNDATLSASVSDDGNPVNALHITWSQVAGPFPALLSDSHSLNPTVEFGAAGSYHFRLRADDEELVSVGDVIVTVHAENNHVDRGLAGHWKLDEVAGNTASDSSSHNNHAVVNRVFEWTTGYIGNALHLGYGGGYADYGFLYDAPSLRPNQFTVSIWVRADMKPSAMLVPYSLFFTKLDWVANTGFEFGYLLPGQLGLRVMTGTDVFAREELTVPLDDLETGWHHLCAVYDGNYLRLYRNGSEIAGKRIGNIQINHGERIGAFGQNFMGTIDDLRLYNRALSPTEVEELFSVVPILAN